jgi:ABC-2 type transport system permease protein
MHHLANIFWLGTKELRSLSRDFVFLGLLVYSFSIAIYSQAQSMSQELYNASIAVVDEDHSLLSRRIIQAFLPPYFKPAEEILSDEIDASMDAARYTFVIDIPPGFEKDLVAGRRPAVQVNVDATAMMQAGIGGGYIERIIDTEVARFASRGGAGQAAPVDLVIHLAFNPNVMTSWFTSIMAVVNNVTLLAIILAGAAIVRERERGTIDHLLSMPLAPVEIALAKVWANALVIMVAVGLSLVIVVEALLGVPILHSVPLFMIGVMLYLFFATAIGVFLGTFARSMPQLGLLVILIIAPMNLLSGSNTPLESMPPWLQDVMQLSPSTHFVSFAQAILYRGAGLDIVWPQFVAVAVAGGVFLTCALLRFRRVAAAAA